MSDITYVFRTAPHFSSAGREGIDAVLAASAYSENLSVVFIDDGVAQLLSDQDSSDILSKNYAPMFKLLELYDVEQVYICQDSLDKIGVNAEDLIIEAEILSRAEINQHLHASRKLLSF